MSRPSKAVFAGLAFVIAYIIVVVTLPDYFGRLNWTVEAIYWAICGTLWVFPVRWLMLWSVHKR